MFKWIYELKAKLQEKLSEKGQGMTEYAIILAVVAAVAVAVFYGSSDEGGGLEGTISKAYNKANEKIDAIGPDATTGGTGSDTTGGTT